MYNLIQGANKVVVVVVVIVVIVVVVVVVVVAAAAAAVEKPSSFQGPLVYLLPHHNTQITFTSFQVQENLQCSEAKPELHFHKSGLTLTAVTCSTNYNWSMLTGQGPISLRGKRKR